MIFRKTAEKIQVFFKIKKTCTLHEDQQTFLIISRSVLLRMKNVSDKSCTKTRTHFRFKNFFSENRAEYEKMWKKKIVQSGTPRKTI